MLGTIPTPTAGDYGLVASACFRGGDRERALDLVEEAKVKGLRPYGEIYAPVMMGKVGAFYVACNHDLGGGVIAFLRTYCISSLLLLLLCQPVVSPMKTGLWAWYYSKSSNPSRIPAMNPASWRPIQQP